MPVDPSLLAHPAVRAEAERLAREHVGATLSLRGVPVVHGTTPDALVRAVAEVQAALLADASRPASRDWMARRIAEAVGLTCVATAPGWARFTAFSLWELAATRGGGWERRYFSSEPSNLGRPDNYVIVPGISTVADPAEALTLAFLAVVR